MSRPAAGDYLPYYDRYIALVQGNDPAAVIENYSSELLRFYQELPEALANHAYQPGKWSLKDVLQHVIDTERIMAYRLLRVSRNDQTPLPSFEENDYAVEAKAGNRSFDAIKTEFEAVRRSTDLLIRSLTEQQLNHQGTASQHNITALALVYIIFGHMIHHRAIIEERYL